MLTEPGIVNVERTSSGDYAIGKNTQVLHRLTKLIATDQVVKESIVVNIETLGRVAKITPLVLNEIRPKGFQGAVHDWIIPSMTPRR